MSFEFNSRETQMNKLRWRLHHKMEFVFDNKACLGKPVAVSSCHHDMSMCADRAPKGLGADLHNTWKAMETEANNQQITQVTKREPGERSCATINEPSSSPARETLSGTPPPLDLIDQSIGKHRQHMHTEDNEGTGHKWEHSSH